MDTRETFFIDEINPYLNCIPSLPLAILSGGEITAYAPYFFDVLPLECMTLIYTEGGSAKLTSDTRFFALEADTVLLMQCNKPFQINIISQPWKYKVFFITGGTLPFFDKFLQDLPTLAKPVIPVPSHSDIVHNIKKLTLYFDDNSEECQLYISSLLYNILTDITIRLTGQKKNDSIPKYMREIKKCFDSSFDVEYSLNELERRFAISKYRLCREFKQYYGTSPLQYLNKTRINAAKHYLETTDLKIHEIGTLVGIENTNHFINLFKKYTGITPYQYKQNN